MLCWPGPAVIMPPRQRQAAASLSVAGPERLSGCDPGPAGPRRWPGRPGPGSLALAGCPGHSLTRRLTTLTPPGRGSEPESLTRTRSQALSPGSASDSKSESGLGLGVRVPGRLGLVTSHCSRTRESDSVLAHGGTLLTRSH
eukprot:2461840-Rhodomonas_salina.1